jgi:Sigma-70 region 2
MQGMGLVDDEHLDPERFRVVARSMRVAPQDVEDVAQNAAVRVLEKAELVARAASQAPYVAQICRNEARRHRRRARRYGERLTPLPEEQELPAAGQDPEAIPSSAPKDTARPSPEEGCDRFAEESLMARVRLESGPGAPAGSLRACRLLREHRDRYTFGALAAERDAMVQRLRCADR